MMFEGNSFPAPLDEGQFEEWLEKGRSNRIGYQYLVILWDAMDECYLPSYTESREEWESYTHYSRSTERESLIAVYDLYSESRLAT
jgi:hypothetical protein